MFHKKALKNTITCFVIFALVFSTLVVATLAALNYSDTIVLNVSANKNFFGGGGSATASYRSGSHMHGDEQGYFHSNSYIGVGIYAYGEGELPIDGGWVSNYQSSTASNSINTPFGWDLVRISSDAGFGCGYCEYEDEVSCDAVP